MDALLAIAGTSGRSRRTVPLGFPLDDDSFLLGNEEKKKVKKIRRKQRPVKEKKKKDNAALDETDFISKEWRKKKSEEFVCKKMYDCQEYSSKLRIKPVCKDAACVFIRKRSTRFKYIRLHKFINCGSIPVIFKTKLKIQKVSSDSLTNVEGLLSQLNISTAPSPTSTMSDKSKQKRAVRKFLSVDTKEKSPKKTKGRSILDKKPHPMKGYISKSEMYEGLEKGTLVKGFIRINPRNYREAYVSNEDRSVLDYIILTIDDRNGAMEGDEVVLEVKPQSEWKDGKATASVVYILKKVRRAQNYNT